MDLFGYLLFVVIISIGFAPESFGKTLAQIRKGYEKEMTK